jgi:hypothetical protein
MGFYLIAFPPTLYFHLSEKEFTLSHFASLVPLSVFTGFESFSSLALF